MARLRPPRDGVTVRMYRQGHGDCFLLALPPETGDEPVYVLIDCGYKPGSPGYLPAKPKIADIVKNIGEATGDRLDLVILTHEHQDHLNGLWKKRNPYFGRFTIGRAWLAWTESPDDPLAEELRRRHDDALLNLAEARQSLALAAGEDDALVRRLDSLLGLELGGEDEAPTGAELLALAGQPEASVNKQGLKLVKDKAAKNEGVSYLSPGDGPLTVPGTAVRAYVFGPPRDPELLRDEDPRGSEAFPDDTAHAFTFAAAASDEAGAGMSAAPFDRRFGTSLNVIREERDPFFVAHYGEEEEGSDDTDQHAVPDNAPWRRIDHEWLASAETLALALNTGVNNTSLVLAFELPLSKRVLFFVGDAQRGNWISWRDLFWRDGEATVTPRDLLARTVLYKVGHHGSHNATLAGAPGDEHANLAWMGTGAAASEFTALITAVNEWAVTENDPPWHHPLPSIKRALLEKAQGRVLQTDEKYDRDRPPAGVPAASWEAFCDRCAFDPLYFDLTIEDA